MSVGTTTRLNKPLENLFGPTEVVDSRYRGENETKFKLSSGAVLELPPFAPLAKGDEIFFKGVYPQVILEKRKTSVPLAPAWSEHFDVRLSGEIIEITIKEVETEAEAYALKRLKHHHYRGQNVAGRVAPLIAVAHHPLLPEVVGFIEITSALLVNTARKPLLDRPFSDAENDIVWQRWDMKTAKEQTKRIARISRCVVYPEIRGLGIAALLAKAAVNYTRERWHYGGARPLFLEITADMLRYTPFVRGAGFKYVGDTEGNEARVLKDMNYLLRRTIRSGDDTNFPKGGGGIMHLQRSYATTLLATMNRREWSLEQLLNVLRKSPEGLSDEEWVAMHHVYRRPKPTYIAGLTPAACLHLKTVVPQTHESKSIQRKKIATRVRMTPLLEIENYSLHASAQPSTTGRSRKVAEAFGIVSKALEQPLFEGLSFNVSQGQIILITGPSGTGKSLLLRAMADAAQKGLGKLPASVCAKTGEIRGQTKAAWVMTERSAESPIDLLSDVSIEAALVALSNAGLAEASLFVRPSSYLSDGQLYRLGIARALTTEPKVLFIDAFCEPLDDLSAASVCKKIRLLADQQGMACVVATASPRRLLHELQPNLVVQLLPGRSVLTSAGKNFLERFGEN
ncbi:ATP-binding cassette domain-containing protein [Variovorax sp. AFSI2.2]|uniref:ATP-binding cassette domain-containing protein n=1 Tax=Variovorax sp. AFSI2.2 TaxID=3384160 RepID=UPI003EBF56BC